MFDKEKPPSQKWILVHQGNYVLDKLKIGLHMAQLETSEQAVTGLFLAKSDMFSMEGFVEVIG